MQSWGFIEVIGYVPAVAAADAMTKAADVELVGTEIIGGAFLTVAIRGDIGAVRTAIDAGAEAAKAVGKVHCTNVIARPTAGAAKILNLKMDE